VNVESEPSPEPGASRQGRGRPRQPETRDAILRATIELLTEVGVDGATTNAIVARTGCSKATIYRRWSSRDELLMDALRMVFRSEPDDIRSGVGLEQELGLAHAAARRGARAFDSPLFREVFPTVARELLSGEAIGRQFRADVFQPVRAGAKARLQERVERGEIESAVDPDLLFDLIYGGLLYRVLMGEPIDERVTDSMADLVMTGAATPGSRTKG